MPQKIIGREEYEENRDECARPEGVKPEFFFVELSRLFGSINAEEAFARELLVRVVTKRGEGDFPRVWLERLSDDGKPLGGKAEELTLDPDGILLGPNWEEKGCLRGGKAPSKDGVNWTKEQLLVPAFVGAEAKPREQQQTVSVPSPEEWSMY